MVSIFKVYAFSRSYIRRTINKLPQLKNIQREKSFIYFHPAGYIISFAICMFEKASKHPRDILNIYQGIELNRNSSLERKEHLL